MGDAAEEGEIAEGREREHPDGDGGGEAAEAGGCDSAEHGKEETREAEVTDLERARSELLDIVACAYQGMWTQPLIARVTEILAAACRESAEAERARHEGASEIIQRAAELLKTGTEYERGAAEMRERAAREARYWTASQKVADRILALPLTPEEPA